MEGVRETGVKRGYKGVRKGGLGLRSRRKHRRKSLLRGRQRAGRRGLRDGRGGHPKPVSGCKEKGKMTEIY